MTQGIKQQVGGLGKGAVKQILQEPLEIAKTASEQVVGNETSSDSQSVSQQQQQKTVVPSVEERMRRTRMQAIEQELKEIRVYKEKSSQEAQITEEQRKKQEVEQKDEVESESIFQKGLKLVTGRLKRRVERRLQKAA